MRGQELVGSFWSSIRTLSPNPISRQGQSWKSHVRYRTAVSQCIPRRCTITGSPPFVSGARVIIKTSTRSRSLSQLRSSGNPPQPPEDTHVHNPGWIFQPRSGRNITNYFFLAQFQGSAIEENFKYRWDGSCAHFLFNSNAFQRTTFSFAILVSKRYIVRELPSLHNENIRPDWKTKREE